MHSIFKPQKNDENNLELFLEKYPIEDVWRFFVERTRYYDGEDREAWLGFEDREPGYLLNVTKGFCFILDNIVNHKPFNLTMIKSLHKICTQNVENMQENMPGELRNTTVCLALTEWTNTTEGLKENIDLFKKIEKKHGEFGIQIHKLKKNKNLVPYIEDFNADSEIIAESVMQLVYTQKELYFVTSPGKKDFIEMISQEFIDELNDHLTETETENQKLQAIFKFIQNIVIYHPFMDGVGRTFAMLMLQYLLLKNNLSPFLIVDSNIIPGWSVSELIEEYKRGKKEMKAILHNDLFQSKKVGCLGAYTERLLEIDTNQLLSELDEKDVDIFNRSKSEYSQIRTDLLKKLKAEKSQLKYEQYNP